MTRRDITPPAVKRSGRPIRVYTEGDRVKVQWTDPDTGTRRYETRPRTPADQREVRAFALGLVARLEERERAPKAGALTVRELWDAYRLSEEPHQRLRTRDLHLWRWRKFEDRVGKGTPATAITADTMDELRAYLSRRQALSQVRSVFTTVRAVFNWGETRKKIPPHALHGYRFKMPKDAVVNEPAEWSNAEWDALLRWFGGGQVDRWWRAWAITQVAGSLGPRIRALLHLRWEDVDLARWQVTWRARWDKLGRERVQPLTWDAYAALLTARQAQARAGYTGPWVFPAYRRERQTAKAREAAGVLTYTTYHTQLKAACVGAGVPWLKWRAAHGWRKMAAGNAYDATGDAKAALDWIGDTDPRRMREYLKRRDARQEATAGAIDAQGVPHGPPHSGGGRQGEGSSVLAGKGLS